MNEYEEILDTLVKKLGKDALKNSNTARYIEDYTPKSDPLVKNRLKFVFMSAIFSRFSSASDASVIVTRLQNELFYPADLANMLVSLFAKYLGIDVSSVLKINNFYGTSNTSSNVTQNQNINSNINVGGDFVYVKTSPRISLKGIYVCIHQVTQQEYFNIMGTNPSYFQGLHNPVENVTFFDAIEYCNLRSQLEGLNTCYVTKGNKVTCDFSSNGYRLLTELEWEFACRGGFESKGFKYSGSDNIKDVAWYSENSGGGTHPVMQKKPNELGLYDMSGNVHEWCWDWYAESLSSVVGPAGPSSGSHHVIRGGGWGNHYELCECGCRDYDSTPWNSPEDIGFRVARSVL